MTVVLTNFSRAHIERELDPSELGADGETA